MLLRVNIIYTCNNNTYVHQLYVKPYYNLFLPIPFWNTYMHPTLQRNKHSYGIIQFVYSSLSISHRFNPTTYRCGIDAVHSKGEREVNKHTHLLSYSHTKHTLSLPHPSLSLSHTHTRTHAQIYTTRHTIKASAINIL